MEKTPCCATSDKLSIKQLMIGGHLVGIAHLDEIMSDTRDLDLQNEDDVTQTLLSKVKIFNYVPSSAASDYKNALLEEYQRRGRAHED